MTIRVSEASALRIFLCTFFLALAINIAVGQGSGTNPPRHVLLIGIDGMTSDGLQYAMLPNLYALIGRGAVSLTTRAVMPTVSAPNWMSILSGAGPEQHGVTSNRWSLASASIRPVDADGDGYFPGLFSVVSNVMPGTEIGAVYDWDGIGRILNRKDLRYAEKVTGSSTVTEKAAAYLTGKKPRLLFVYYGHPDEVGHERGFTSREYLDALAEVDAEIGKLLSAMRAAAIEDETTVFVVTDHGAKPTGHGGESMDEIEVPWIVAGADVQARGILREPNNTMNTAATILHLFSLRPPASWVAQSYMAPFRPSRPGSAFVPKPRSTLQSGIYTESRMLEFQTTATGAEIRFTLDGTHPTRESLLYTGPVRIYNTAEIRAACFTIDGESQITTADVAIVPDVQAAMLVNPASEQYPAQGALSLIDGRTASADMHNPRWMGFLGSDLVLTIRYAQKRSIRSVTVSFLRDQASWIFTPDTVTVYSSDDGALFEMRQSVSPAQDIEGSEARILRLELTPAAFNTEWLRVVVKNTGVCPPGHPGVGKKAWLFVDEIEVK